MFSLACASCYLDFFSFLEGLGTVELEAVGFARGFLIEAFGLRFLVATWIAGVDLGLGFFSVFEVGLVAAAVASRASLRSRLLR